MAEAIRDAALLFAVSFALAVTPAGAQPRDGINPMALQAHMEFLADDLLEGREAGTEGFNLAALYVASQFRAIGLEPAGVRGYMQPVPLRRSILVPGSVTLRITGANAATVFTDNDHVLAYPSSSTEHERLAGDVVFAAHGVVAAQFQRDDYASLDVRGKIVVVLGGPPPGLPAEAAAHLGSPTTQAMRATERGARGLIVIYTPALQRRLPFDRLAPITRQARMTWVAPEISPLPGGAPSAVAFIDETAATALFEGAPLSYAQVRAGDQSVHGFGLARGIEFSRSSQLSDATSENVVAMLPGSDPRLSREVVVVTTHLDHVGLGPEIDGDRIYNGAIDNASGVAATLEMARVLRLDRPRRSVLFVAVTAEEKGLIGSDYFSRAPTVDANRIVGAINLDGVMAFYDFRSIIGYGVESSTLHEPLVRAARSMGLTLMPDPNPSVSIFTQSDHYSFVRRGVPAVFLQMGEGPAPDGSSGLALSEAWDSAHLHQPSDDLSRPIDYAIFARFTELYRRFTREAANMPSPPRWYANDFFGDTFAPNAPRAARPDN